jgi:hypothetical protein
MWRVQGGGDAVRAGELLCGYAQTLAGERLVEMGRACLTYFDHGIHGMRCADSSGSVVESVFNARFPQMTAIAVVPKPMSNDA